MEERLTGPIDVRAVSSSTFSMAERERSLGGGLTRVEEDMVVEKQLN